MKVPRVCIVGAGMAGLRCADLLLESGLHVTMFEARDRIGGRVSLSLHSKDRALTRRSVINPHFSDLKLTCRLLMDLLTTLTYSRSGCNQIHGTDHNPFMKLAQETGTTTYLPEDVHSIFLKDGKHLQGEEALKLWTAVEDLISEGVNFSRTSSASISEKTSLWNWFSQRAEKLDVEDRERDRMLQVVHDWGGYAGESIETQSMKNLWMETNMPGGTAICFLAPNFGGSLLTLLSRKSYGRNNVLQDSRESCKACPRAS
jgi:monoamine oxidase